MGNILIINGSPRAPISNSKRYAELFQASCRADTAYCQITKTNHSALCEKMEHASDVLLVFPLYADSLPVTLLHFLKHLEVHPPKHKPAISVLINCGFLEYQQNDTAVDMVSLFCRQNGYPFGSVLKIGSGEAILSTPFQVLAKRKIKKLASSIAAKQYRTLHVAMPLSKKMFVSASTKYWIAYGEKNGCTKEQMDTAQIETQT